MAHAPMVNSRSILETVLVFVQRPVSLHAIQMLIAPPAKRATRYLRRLALIPFALDVAHHAWQISFCH